MKSGKTSELTRFVFHVHKPKAEMLAGLVAGAAKKAGYALEIAKDARPRPGSVGIFYGLSPETYPAFQFYKAENRAIYLDNGWMSTPTLPTFRFTWNGVQSFLQDMPTSPKYEFIRFGELPRIKRNPQRDIALLILQSPQYFEYLRLGYTRENWQRAVTRMLELKGYRVQVREKPTKKDPEAETFFDQMARAGIVVSLNSAATLKALRYGIPAYCLLDCTLSPYAPVRIPDLGKAGRIAEQDLLTLCLKLASYEIDRREMSAAKLFDKLLNVPPEKRRGHWYAKD